MAAREGSETNFERTSMNIRGILFDINGTLIDIHTDENYEDIYRSLSNFLSYHGVYVDRWALKDEYFRIMDEQRKAAGETYPEFDVVALWRELLLRRSGYSVVMDAQKVDSLSRFMAQMYRSLSLFKLQLYPDVRNVLDQLAGRYKLAALSDAQSAWGMPEIKAVKIDHYFDSVILSGDLGFRKPDERIFELALKGMGLKPAEVIFVGNDMFRDIYGARSCGMKTVFFWSNQGRKSANGVQADYIIYKFGELLQAIEFLKNIGS